MDHFCFTKVFEPNIQKLTYRLHQGPNFRVHPSFRSPFSDNHNVLIRSLQGRLRDKGEQCTRPRAQRQRGPCTQIIILFSTDHNIVLLSIKEADNKIILREGWALWVLRLVHVLKQINLIGLIWTNE